MSHQQVFHSFEEIGSLLFPDGEKAVVKETTESVAPLKAKSEIASTPKKQKAKNNNTQVRKGKAISIKDLVQQPVKYRGSAGQIPKLFVGGKAILNNMSYYESAKVMMAHYGTIDGIVEHENSITAALGKKYYNGVIAWAKRAEDDLIEVITKTYSPSKQYALKVLKCTPDGTRFKIRLEDNAGRKFTHWQDTPLRSDKTYVFEILEVIKTVKFDQMLVFKMMHSFKEAQESTSLKNTEQCKRELIVERPELSERDVKKVRLYKKTPYQWRAEILTLGHHKCGKPAICDCCGEPFNTNQGVRVDGKDIYFCNSCSREIYHSSGRGWSGSIISTPMGNKR